MKFKTLLAFCGLAMSSGSFAAVQTWDFVYGDGSGIENDNAHGIGNGSYIDMTVGGVDLVISAWSSTAGTRNRPCNTGPECDPGDNAYDPDPYIRRAELTKYYGGLGAINRDEVDNQPNHAFDSSLSNDGRNSTIDYDMALLQFDTAVKLEEVDVNWIGSDSDITVLSYTGQGEITGNPFGSATKWSDLLTNGWSHNGNYSDLTTSQNQIISNPVQSRYWLVGVYNPAFGNSWSFGNDAIKLAGVVTSVTTGGSTPGIPEPATALLIALGIFGIRRKV